MADLTYPYTITTGNALDPDGVNQNTYQTTPGVSIYETTNGSVDVANFAAGFKVKPHHIRKGEVGDADFAWMAPSVDYFSDLWPGKSSTYIPIAGCSVTFYQRYDCTLAMIFASGFMTAWRQFGKTNAAAWMGGGAFVASPDVRVQLYTGANSGVTHSRREMPQTVWFDVAASVNPIAHISMLESRQTRHFNLSHPMISGHAAPFDGLTAGWRTVGLACYVPQNLFGQDDSDANEDITLALNGAATDDARPLAFYSAVHRLRLYVRNISAVRLL